MAHFLLFLLCFWPLPALSLPESDLSPLYDFLDNHDFYQMKELQGQKNVRLRYAKFGKGQGKKGSLVFVNGRAENILKYIELFYDLQNQGWSPIYTYDHRGQGFSERLLPDPLTGYVEDYSLYRKDLEAFIQRVKEDPAVSKENLFLIAHSMGGTIVVDYLQTKKNSPFKAVVLSSPLFRIKTTKSAFEIGIVSLYCLIAPCKNPIARKASYTALTDSPARIQFDKYLKKKFPSAALGPPSFHWVVESFKISKQIMKEDKIKQIQTPILILQGKKDSLVDNSFHDRFCSILSKTHCQIKSLSGKHESFIERDKIRQATIKETTHFFLENR